jgi:hypothetical protein
MSGFVDTYGSAIIADKIRDWIFNGQSFGTCYTQTIGGAAQGNFALSIFNPSGNNKKNILVYSAKAISNNFTAVVGLFLDAADPAYNQSPSSQFESWSKHVVNRKRNGQRLDNFMAEQQL